MNLYEFTVPLIRNDGRPYADHTHEQFYRDVATAAGGYTLYDSAVGFWRDPKTGAEYHEGMIPLRVACDWNAKQAIVEAFRRAFPDQISIMVSCIGSAEFVEGSNG